MTWAGKMEDGQASGCLPFLAVVEVDEGERTVVLSGSHPEKAMAGHSCPDLHLRAPGSLTGMESLAPMGLSVTLAWFLKLTILALQGGSFLCDPVTQPQPRPVSPLA